jgi:hypothetical protein
LLGATLEAFIKRSAFDADEDAIATPALVLLSATTREARLTFRPADTAELDPFEEKWWLARVTLADGTVHQAEAHQGPLVFSPLGGDPDLQADYAEGIAEAIDLGATITALPDFMSNFPIIRTDITGLTGGTAADLDGVSAEDLAVLANGSVFELSFPDGVRVRYELRDRADDDEEVSAAEGGDVIFCDHDEARCWELTEVKKGKYPCTWNPDTAKYHQVLGYGTDATSVTPAIATEADAFSLPA